MAVLAGDRQGPVWTTSGLLLWRGRIGRFGTCVARMGNTASVARRVAGDRESQQGPESELEQRERMPLPSQEAGGLSWRK